VEDGAGSKPGGRASKCWIHCLLCVEDGAPYRRRIVDRDGQSLKGASATASQDGAPLLNAKESIA
jgi:hypothetical protein